MTLVLPAIIAGGYSRRFGDNKALAMWRHKALIDHVFESLEDTFSARPVVNVRSLSGQPRLTAHVLAYPSPPTLVEDNPDIAGPLAGVLSVMVAALIERSPWVALTACDMPALTTSYWNALLPHMTEDVDAVVVRMNAHLQPLASLIRPEPFYDAAQALLSEAQTAPTPQKIGPNAVLRRIQRKVVIEAADLRYQLSDLERQLTNVNTPEDLLALDAF